MGKLKCACLNVTIHVKEVLASEIDGKKFVSDGCAEDFFSSLLVEVELGVGGITKELSVLVRKHRSEDWDVFTCLNCGTKCYALHAIKGFNRVLVSKHLINDCKKQEELSKQDNFSTAFKIILDKEQIETNGESDTPVTLGQNSLAKSMSSVQELLKKYLKAEEAAMEERIRLYTEQQKSAFMSLRTKAFKDKMSIQRVLADVEQKSLTDSISDAIFTDGNQRLPFVQASLDKSPHIFRSFNASSHKATSSPVNMRPVHITQVPVTQQQRNQQSSGTKKGNSSFQRITNQSVMDGNAEADIMFDIEGFSSADCEPFFESDPEDESSDTSSQPDDNIIMANIHTNSISHTQSHTVYSASLPISMPAITRTSRSWEEEDGQHDKILPSRPDKIAESMKALALSVQNTSQDMFGDLPRSRTNTYAHSHRY